MPCMYTRYKDIYTHVLHFLALFFPIMYVSCLSLPLFLFLFLFLHRCCWPRVSSAHSLAFILLPFSCFSFLLHRCKDLYVLQFHLPRWGLLLRIIFFSSSIFRRHWTSPLPPFHQARNLVLLPLLILLLPLRLPLPPRLPPRLHNPLILLILPLIPLYIILIRNLLNLPSIPIRFIDQRFPFL